jgi:exodeoxyribonuclease-3
MAVKIISYNINGIRAAERKGLSEWLDQARPDIACFQEVKANEDQVDLTVYEDLGYHIFWHSAEKKGYSGVAIFSKDEPKHVEIGCGIEKYDREGRVIRADYENFSVMSVYMPSGSSGDVRQDFKMEWLADFDDYIQKLKKEIPNLIISGDYNICHQAIDIHDPVRNKNSSGFLPEEREWMSQFLDKGFIDSFRNLNPDAKDEYSWWSYRANARNNNKGWRIDYHMISESLQDRLNKANILQHVKHSDHCPIEITLS